ncbi:MAG: L-aspartate oxidase [Geodermatophilaceae bacterium]
MSGLPRRLNAAGPGWSRQADVCVVGSGVAGLRTALHARSYGLSVILVTKVNIDDGSTRWAQGGIAAVLDPTDTPAAHAADTHAAGVGLCDPVAVDVLVNEGPGRLRELIELGAAFDRTPDGKLALTREGGHHARRIVHAGGDATGAEVQRALHAAIVGDAGIDLIEHAMVLDLLLAADGRAAGVSLHVLGEGSTDGVGAVLARAVVLATGGMGQIYAATTNPSVSTGDGVALGLRAGAVAADLEFVQFHPTSLYLGPQATGQQPLISEAMRGEGAFLIDGGGQRFMTGIHPLADLAPRDVVAKAITRVMLREASDHVRLDATGIADLDARFPSIIASCRAAGIEPRSEPIPVRPAAHYASGGLRTDVWGATSVPGLFACGEVACTGVHGANRLASNSLLEGLVFAARIGAALGKDLSPQADPVPAQAPYGALDPAIRSELTAAMSTHVAALRSGDGLAKAGETLRDLSIRAVQEPGPAAWEVTDLLMVASALTAAATQRTETRGCHWRADHPDADASWLGRIDVTLDADGTLQTAFNPLRIGAESDAAQGATV